MQSATLDDWKTKHTKTMVKWGNARAKAYYEAKLPKGFTPPGPHAGKPALEKWMRDKYEKGKYNADELPPKNSFGEDGKKSKKSKQSKKASEAPAAVSAPVAAEEDLLGDLTGGNNTPASVSCAPALSAPAPVPAPAPSAGDDFDLLGGLTPTPGPTERTVSAPAPVAAPTGSFGFDPFAVMARQAATPPPSSPALAQGRSGGSISSLGASYGAPPSASKASIMAAYTAGGSSGGQAPRPSHGVVGGGMGGGANKAAAISAMMGPPMGGGGFPQPGYGVPAGHMYRR